MVNKVGRPKGDNNKEYNYTLRMDESTKQRLEEYCEKKKITKSEALRKAIDIISISDTNNDEE